MLISECPPGFVARAQGFPRRNRIVSGSSLGVVIAEATERSGSLITARLAAEQNREVFAVPSHPLEARAAGTNRLIKEGAIFTTCADDIAEALQPQLRSFDAPMPAPPSDRPSPAVQATPAMPAHNAEQKSFDFIGEASEGLLKLLSLSPIDVDELCRLSGLEAQLVSAALLSLDISGRIERRGLRQVALRP